MRQTIRARAYVQDRDPPFPRCRLRQVVLTLPEQPRIPFYNHPNQDKLYSKFMGLAHTCLEELICKMFGTPGYKVEMIVFLHAHGRRGSYNLHLHVIFAEGAFDSENTE